MPSNHHLLDCSITICSLYHLATICSTICSIICSTIYLPSALSSALPSKLTSYHLLYHLLYHLITICSAHSLPHLPLAAHQLDGGGVHDGEVPPGDGPAKLVVRRALVDALRVGRHPPDDQVAPLRLLQVWVRRRVYLRASEGRGRNNITMTACFTIKLPPM